MTTKLTRYAAGGVIRKGRAPNPGVLGLFINPSSAPKRRTKKTGGSTSMARKRRKRRGKKRTGNKKRTYKKRTYKRSYKKRSRRKNPSSRKKTYRRRRRNAEGNGADKSLILLRSNNWQDQIKPAVAGAIGFAAPGLIDYLTRNKLSEKAKGFFEGKDRAGQKGQALVSIGTFALGFWASNRVKLLKEYRAALLMGLGVRAFRDILDAMLGTEKDSWSASIRNVFGITGSMAGYDSQDLGDYYYDQPEMMGDYHYDQPEMLAGDRSFGDMGGERSYGDMGSYSDNEGDMVAGNPFDDPFDSKY